MLNTFPLRRGRLGDALAGRGRELPRDIESLMPQIQQQAATLDMGQIMSLVKGA